MPRREALWVEEEKEKRREREKATENASRKWARFRPLCRRASLISAGNGRSGRVKPPIQKSNYLAPSDHTFRSLAAAAAADACNLSAAVLKRRGLRESGRRGQSGPATCCRCKLDSG